jgi:hypothetical protein
MIYVGQVQNPKYLDKTWAGFNGYVTGIVEGSVGVMCACAPSLRRFLSVWFRGQTRTPSAGTPKTPSSNDSAAKRSVRSDGDPYRYPGSGAGAGAVDIEGGVFEDKAPYVFDERAVAEPEMGMGSGRITTRRKDKAPVAGGRTFYFDASVAEPEPGEDHYDIR